MIEMFVLFGFVVCVFDRLFIDIVNWFSILYLY